jgi:hypothetical protein
LYAEQGRRPFLIAYRQFEGAFDEPSFKPPRFGQ